MNKMKMVLAACLLIAAIIAVCGCLGDNTSARKVYADDYLIKFLVEDPSSAADRSTITFTQMEAAATYVHGDGTYMIYNYNVTFKSKADGEDHYALATIVIEKSGDKIQDSVIVFDGHIDLVKKRDYRL